MNTTSPESDALRTRIARILWERNNRLPWGNGGGAEQSFLDDADTLVALLGLTEWDDGPSNTMVRYMTQWFERENASVPLEPLSPEKHVLRSRGLRGNTQAECSCGWISDPSYPSLAYEMGLVHRAREAEAALDRVTRERNALLSGEDGGAHERGCRDGCAEKGEG